MRRTFDTCFTISLLYHLYVLFVWISYQARFGLKISYPAIVFTMVLGLLNCGSFIVHILLLGTEAKSSHCQFFCMPCACVHVLLPGTRRYNRTGGGGGGFPPLDVSRDNFAEFFFRAPRFRDFFLSSLAQLWTLFSYKSGAPFRGYATLCNRASAQNMGIFWICVQNIWKIIWLFVLKIHFGL